MYSVLTFKNSSISNEVESTWELLQSASCDNWFFKSWSFDLWSLIRTTLLSKSFKPLRVYFWSFPEQLSAVRLISSSVELNIWWYLQLILYFPEFSIAFISSYVLTSIGACKSLICFKKLSCLQQISYQKVTIYNYNYYDGLWGWNYVLVN